MSLVTKTVSEKQLVANRANGSKSTGPRTERGKSRSRFNAVTHGIFAGSLVESMRSLNEDPREFRAILYELCESFQPRDGLEEQLVEEIAVNRWRRQRILRAEGKSLAQPPGELTMLGDVFGGEHKKNDSATDRRFLPTEKDLDKIIRYETMLDRQFERKIQLLLGRRSMLGR